MLLSRSSCSRSVHPLVGLQEDLNICTVDPLVVLQEDRQNYYKYKVCGKVQRANLTCDVIRKVAPFVLSKV